jgi:hypothetical protein
MSQWNQWRKEGENNLVSGGRNESQSSEGQVEEDNQSKTLATI